jgi:predicted NAD/FAD-binding protein
MRGHRLLPGVGWFFKVVSMRVAVIGSGISGLASAWLLQQSADVHLFECDNRLGGHAHTVDAQFGDARVPVDTGFIVFNPLNYPNLVNLFTELDVATIDSDMSFSVSMGNGQMEYEGSIRGLFAQPGNWIKPRYWSMLVDLVRFYRTAPRQLESGPATETLGAFIARNSYADAFVADHLLPMGAAIWSASSQRMMDFPARAFMRFMENHKLLNFIDRPQWRTVAGGSRAYVNAIAASLGKAVHLNSDIKGIRRGNNGVYLTLVGQGEIWFDKVILAAHADQSLALISDPSAAERAILGDFSFQDNHAVLHSDPALMPRRRAAWASWNYLSGPEPAGRLQSDHRRPNDLCLTYWMNRLQSIDQRYPLFETLNPIFMPDPDLIRGEYIYRHPVFDGKAIAAQHQLAEIQGQNGIYFAGAWTGYGFHEDGLKSAIAAALSLGAKVPWPTQVRPWPRAATEIENSA